MEEDLDFEPRDENELFRKGKRGNAYEIEEGKEPLQSESDQCNESEDEKEEIGHEERKLKPDDLSPEEKIEEQGASVDCDYVKRNDEKSGFKHEKN